MEVLKNKGINGLRYLERYTKTDMVYLVKGGFWSIFSQIIVTVSTLLLAMAFAYFISKETYGQYKFILSLANILGVFTLTGLGTAVMKSVTGGFEGTLNDIFWKNIKWSVLFFLVILGISIYYFVNENISLAISILVVGSFSPFIASTNLYNSFLVAKKDFKRSSIYFNLIGNVFPAFCLFITMLITNKPIWFVAVYFTSNTLIGLILYLRVLKIYKPNDKVDSGALGYSKHLSIINILGTIVDNIDQVLVFHYIGPAQLAIYNFAIAIPNQIKGPMKGLASLIFPKFAERSDKEIRHGMKNKYFLLFISSIVIIITYIVLAPYIFHILFPKYTDSIFYSQIFVFYFLGMISSPAEVYLIIRERIKEQYIGTILGTIIQIVLLFVGILYWGLIGLVLARVITKICWSTTNILLYNRASRETT
ncbi:MAG: hypothetical protein A3G99_01360 [Candidatus Zambryskibacteria bacterium RIFCSPLOWO2_12_FULL_39_23]|uniref:Polysaccharide biosynthesis protein C-terminal domain-containing protein n=1 Tax=Candidatus Zambryskibacteria bacterium RIFCSPLOWO2_12_FULL_39_23 TaxID=1802776 RepID=A0A1G2UTR7_9BACT|nr:MAG: hypothetical protein A3E59_02235 [Candidatus Zambryskibacteria bacterium RIFCSPHIGHO2_12_FULL_39_47]OHB12779.1 MAG: hypothetical protein A3G99_01360 [Candidatus Zambryskibacteria bacterium RIFCSPLOWO2_12_FULL_39_23]